MPAAGRGIAASTTDASVTGWLGRVQDISHGGIAFVILRRQFEPGTKLIIDLATNAGECEMCEA